MANAVLHTLFCRRSHKLKGIPPALVALMSMNLTWTSNPWIELFNRTFVAALANLTQKIYSNCGIYFCNNFSLNRCPTKQACYAILRPASTNKPA